MQPSEESATAGNLFFGMFLPLYCHFNFLSGSMFEPCYYSAVALLFTGGHMLQEIRTHDGPKNPYIPLFLRTILGPDYYLPLYTAVRQAPQLSQELPR